MKTRHLVVLLSAAALTAVACSSRRTTIFGHLSGGVDSSRTETHALQIATGERLELVTPHGEIEVRTAAGAAPTLVATLRAGGRTQEEADQVLAGYTLSVEQDSGLVRVAFRGDPTRVRDDGAKLMLGASVDYLVTVPEGVHLRIDTSSGDIRAVGPFGACRLETKFGSIELENGNGDVVAHSDSGDVSVRDLVGGKVTVESGYGTLRLENVQATSLRAESKSGDVVLVNGKAGTIELDTNYGAVSVRGADGDLRAGSRSGDVEIAAARGAMKARSQYGRVAVEGVLTALDARSSSGDVSARALAGSQNLTNWELASGYGEVTLFVPADFGCQLEALTRYGEVECAFPITVDGGKRKNGALKGTVGQGGRTVTLNSSSGNVALKQL